MSDQAALAYMTKDIVERVLELADTPGRLAEYLALQMRELLGGRVVAIVSCPHGPKGGTHEILAVCPERKRGEIDQASLFLMADLTHGLASAEMWDSGSGPAEARAAIEAAGWGKVIAVPLRFGAEFYGSMWVLGLIDDERSSAILEGLRPMIGVFALVLKNSMAYGALEDAVDRRTRELSAGKERLGVILRGINDGVVATDREGRITLVNPAAEAILGLSLTEAMGESSASALRLRNGYDRSAIEDPVAAAVAAGETVALPPDACLERADGTRLEVEGAATPLIGRDGEMTGAVIVLKDVTEKRRMEGAERRAAKLESLGVLAGGIAHDFNNLLSGIFGYLDMAMRRLPEADPVHDYLAKAGSVFGRARDLTRQLLTFAKGGDPQRSASDLGPIVRASVSFALSGSNVDSTIEIEEGLPLCMIDPNQIAQAIDNVVINAKQAMPEGGRVKVRARSADPARERLPGRGRFVALSISDQGGGIPKERLEKVFDPFYTTKPKGTGLGLATVFSIAQRHGGSVEVESELGAGTTFTLFLPAAEEGPPAVAAKAAGKRDRPPGPPGARILVMDDEEYMRDLYVLTLEAESYRVSAVEDGAAAIKAFSEALSEGDPFSVAILDLTVPGGMGGRDAAAIIRPAARGAPIIAASGYASDPVMADPGAYGFDRSLGKPFLGGDLVAMVASLLD